MVFGTGCQRERLFKSLYIVLTFLLAGTVCFYFQGSVEKTAPDHDIAGDTSQPIGETLRPVWGPMDKCYPGTTQQARTPKAMGGPSDAAPKEEPGFQSQGVGEVKSPAGEAASPIPAEKEVAEEKEVAGTPGCENRSHRAPGPLLLPQGSGAVPEETAVHSSEASEVERKEDGPGGPHSP
ncbi:uncharacterized protein AAES06_009174 isoform 2-T3 [Glossophaga mutica]